MTEYLYNSFHINVPLWRDINITFDGAALNQLSPGEFPCGNSSVTYSSCSNDNEIIFVQMLMLCLWGKNMYTSKCNMCNIY